MCGEGYASPETFYSFLRLCRLPTGAALHGFRIAGALDRDL